MKYSYNPPLIIKKIFSNFRWETINNKILLTFDDGPIPETTDLILEQLNGFNIKGLFFCVGENIKKYPSLAEKILSDGHTVGNHTFHHKNLRKLNKKDFDEEIDSFNSMMQKDFNYNVKYFRPPRGRFTLSLSKKLKQKNLTNVMWSLLTYDYKNDLNLVKFAVENYLKKNSIIVLHDSIKSKDIIENSIKFIVEEAEKHHFDFGDPAECLK